MTLLFAFFCTVSVAFAFAFSFSFARQLNMKSNFHCLPTSFQLVLLDVFSFSRAARCSVDNCLGTVGNLFAALSTGNAMTGAGTGFSWSTKANLHAEQQLAAAAVVKILWHNCDFAFGIHWNCHGSATMAVTPTVGARCSTPWLWCQLQHLLQFTCQSSICMRTDSGP